MKHLHRSTVLANRPSSKRFLPLAAAMAGIILAPAPTWAITWTNPGTGLWGTGTNWSSGLVPNNDVAEVSNGGIAQIVAGDNFTNTEVWAGNGTAGAMTQSGGTLNVNAWFVVGRGVGSGSYTMSGGTINKTGGGNSLLADGTGSSANMVISNDANFNSTSGEFWLGQTGTATLEIKDNANFAVNNWLAIGRNGGTGTLNMSGGTLTKTTTNGNITFAGVGSGGSGFVNQTGGILTNTASETWMMETGSGTGQWNMSGTAVSNLGVMRVGLGGTGNASVNLSGSAALTATTMVLAGGGSVSGTVNLNGGTLTVNQITPGAGTGTRGINFNGGVLKANQDEPAFLSGFTGTQLNIQAGGATLNTNGKNVGLAAPLSGSGGFTKAGTGTLSLTSAQTYTGPTIITGGTVKMTANTTGYTGLPAGTAGFWGFEDANNLFKDYSGNGNDLKVGGGTVVASGAVPGGTGSIALSGNGYLVTNSGNFPTNVPTGNQPYSIALWVNVNNTGNNGFVGWGNYGTGNQVTAFRNNGPSTFVNYWWANDAVGATPGSMQGTWRHLAVTYDPVSSARTVYFDGAQIFQDFPAIGSHNSIASNFRVGSTNLAEYFGGSMANLLITNTTLSAADITAAKNGFTRTMTGKTDLLPTTTKLQLGTGGTFDLFGGQQTIGSLADNAGAGGTILNSGTAASTLKVGTDNTSSLFSGAIQNGTGTMSLTKVGTGKLTLSGPANTFTGPTSVEDGALRIDGTVSSSAFTVKKGVLAGTGAIGAAVSIGDGVGSAGEAILSPGDDGLIESLNTGALSFLQDSALKLDLNIVGGSSLTADVVIASGQLNVTAGAALTFVPLGGSNVLTQGTKFSIIDYTGTWNGGVFTQGVGGAPLLDDSVFAIGANSFRIDYNAAGADVTLTVVPEPASVASLLGGLGVLLGLRRRKRA